jgi:hypothetical protein
MNFVAAAILALIAFAGCAPTVRMQVDRAPNWNTAGIRRVAVMPFEHDRSFEQERIARHLTATAAASVSQMGRFTVVSEAEVLRLRYRGESLENHVDALFSGEILDIRGRDSSYVSQRYDPETRQAVDVTVYEREVALTVSYSLERTRDGSIVGMATRTARAGDTKLNFHELRPVSHLLQQCNVLAGLARNLAPYTVIEVRTLMTEKSKDKDLRERMKAAAAQVKRQNYKTAHDMYMKIYGEYGTFAAIYNAAITQEALGETRGAISLMEKASLETGNPRAKTEVTRLTKRLREQETVDTEHKNAARQIDRATEHASSEALKILPFGARVWLVNNERNERDLASSVADGVAAALIRRGVIVVDRENSELIEREFLKQMSGGVSDSDILNAGGRAGANMIVIIAISGTGSMRRLQMRILDVEKGVPILQSDAGSRWNL